MKEDNNSMYWNDHIWFMCALLGVILYGGSLLTSLVDILRFLVRVLTMFGRRNARR